VVVSSEIIVYFEEEMKRVSWQETQKYTLKRRKKMPRVYASDYKKYFPQKIITYPMTGMNIGNEYYKPSHYSTIYDRMHEEEKTFSETPTSKEGEGIVDSALNIGKTAVDFATKNKELISAIGSIAGAASQISRASDSAKQLDAIKRIREIRSRNNDEAVEPKIRDTPNDNSKIQSVNNGDSNIQKAKNIIRNFSSSNPTGRGIKSKKTGGVLKDF